MAETSRPLDDTDRALIAEMRRRPGASRVELARRVGVARNTVQLRLTRLADEGVIIGHGPDLDRHGAGYPVLALVTLTIAQGAHDATVSAIAGIAEVLEIHTVTGRGDLLVKVVAKTNDHLHLLVQRIAAIEHIERTETQLALKTPLHRTVADLVADGPD
jgi:DNA-binding Lrp family transcriptional regulator